MKNLIVLLALFMSVPVFSQTDHVTDIDGNKYNIIKIGKQSWLSENLKTTTLNDGTSINIINSNDRWISTTKPAYSYFNNSKQYKKNYGLLYNFYAVDTEKLCPTGWHVPTKDDWDYLVNYFNGPKLAAHYLKSESFVAPFFGILESSSPNNKPPDTFHTLEIKTSKDGQPLYYAFNVHSTSTPKITLYKRSEHNRPYHHSHSKNISNFTALPGGLRSQGFDYNIGSDAGFWHTSSTRDFIPPGEIESIFLISMFHNSDNVFTINGKKFFGASVRCVKY